MRYLFLLLIFLIAYANAAPNDKNKLKLIKDKELDILREYVQRSRDSLQTEIAERWRVRQNQVQQRESDKEVLAGVRERLERMHVELSRVKEEGLARTDVIEDERKVQETSREELKYVASTIEDVFQKDAEGLIESFPLDVEAKKLDLEKIRRAFKSSGNGAIAFDQFVDYKRKYNLIGAGISFDKKMVLPNSGDPQELGLVRFGNVFVYGMNQNGEPWILRQTGSLGADRYSIEPIKSPVLSEFVTTSMPEWIEKQSVNGMVMFDVLQNAQSKVMIAGEKLDNKQKFFHFVKAGGPVMLPLFGMLLWAVILMVWKIIQFITKSGADNKLSKVVMSFLNKNDIDGAKKYVLKKRGVGARVVKTCLEHSKWNRSSAEKAVKEILIEELPQINKHLNTLAVIAGAAPLMGLLGTVTGMINLFEVITNYGTGDPKMLAGGISEALITTEVGLIVAIPILLVHNFLRNRTNDLQSQMEKHAIRILNKLWPET